VALQFPTRAERPGSLPHIAGLRAQVWPEFMYHDAVLNRLFDRVLADYAEFHFYAWDDEREEVVGVGNAIPAAWDGDVASLPDGGLDAVVEAGFAEGAPEPTVLCAMQILVAPEYRGRDLSCRMIERMSEIGRDHGLGTLIAPVRPTLKHRYPLTPIERTSRGGGTTGRISTRGCERTSGSAPRSSRSPRSRSRCRAPWRSGKRGRRWRFPRAAPTSCLERWRRSRSIASGTKAPTESRTSGWCTRPRPSRRRA